MLDKQKVISKMREIADLQYETIANNTVDIIKRNEKTRHMFLDLFADICNSEKYDVNMEEVKNERE